MKIKKQKLGKVKTNHLTREYIDYRRRINAPPKSTVSIASFRIEGSYPIISFSLSEAKTSVCVGTQFGCQEGRLIVEEDCAISPIHCQFVIVKRHPRVEGCNHTTFVRDFSLNSTTFVNDRRVGFGNSMELHNKASIRLGELPDKNIIIKYTDNEYHDTCEKISRRFKMPVPLYNKYEVRSEEYLGKGAHGMVMKGLNLLTNIDVACKYVFREKIPQEIYDRVSKEASILKQLRHPNIVEFLDYWKDPEHTIIILEYINGGSLLAYINKENKIRFNLWVDLAYQICDALQYMHNNCYMHRDIKASNIMFSDKTFKAVKLIDFGLTKSFIKTEQLKDSIEHTVTGTPAYMPYEIAKELLNHKRTCYYTCAVDMWSFGILNYHALTGNMPFMEEDAQEDQTQTLQMIVSEEINYTPLQEMDLQCAVEFITGLCQKDPISRLTADQAMNHVFFQKLKG